MAESRMLLGSANAFTERESYGIRNSVIEVIERSSVAKPLSWSRMKQLREEMFAKRFSDDDERADATVVCDHISLLAVIEFLDKHDSLGFRIRFDPEEDQDTKAHPGKIMGKLAALVFLRTLMAQQHLR